MERIANEREGVREQLAGEDNGMPKMCFFMHVWEGGKNLFCAPLEERERDKEKEELQWEREWGRHVREWEWASLATGKNFHEQEKFLQDR